MTIAIVFLPLLAALIVGHVIVALKHHFIDRDGLLDRMRFSSGKH